MAVVSRSLKSIRPCWLPPYVCGVHLRYCRHHSSPPSSAEVGLGVCHTPKDCAKITVSGASLQTSAFQILLDKHGISYYAIFLQDMVPGTQGIQ